MLTSLTHTLKTPLNPNEKILKNGPANLQRGIETVGGNLYLTNLRLVFESHAFNVQRGTTLITLGEISSVTKCWTKFLNLIPTVPNSLAVTTNQGQERRFVLVDRNTWISAITSAKTPNSSNGEVAPPPLPPKASGRPEYKGVGGWLLFFCLSLVVFNPLMTLGNLASGYIQAAQYFDRAPILRVIAVNDALLSIGLIGFGIYAGVGLWRIRSGAVSTAKRYLLCSLGYCAFTASVPFMVGSPSAADHIAIIPNITRGVGYFAIWYLYLSESRRVKATYQ